MSINGMSLHGILVLGNDTFSNCSWNDMDKGMLHSLTTNLSGASCACHEPPWIMTGMASFWLTILMGKGTKRGSEVRGKGTKLDEGERQ